MIPDSMESPNSNDSMIPDFPESPSLINPTVVLDDDDILDYDYDALMFELDHDLAKEPAADTPTTIPPPTNVPTQELVEAEPPKPSTSKAPTTPEPKPELKDLVKSIRLIPVRSQINKQVPPSSTITGPSTRSRPAWMRLNPPLPRPTVPPPKPDTTTKPPPAIGLPIPRPLDVAPVTPLLTIQVGVRLTKHLPRQNLQELPVFATVTTTMPGPHFYNNSEIFTEIEFFAKLALSQSPAMFPLRPANISYALTDPYLIYKSEHIPTNLLTTLRLPINFTGPLLQPRAYYYPGQFYTYHVNYLIAYHLPCRLPDITTAEMTFLNNVRNVLNIRHDPLRVQATLLTSYIDLRNSKPPIKRPSQVPLDDTSETPLTKKSNLN